MKYQSRAIALNYIKHKESAIIAKLYTEEKGLQSFIVKGVRSKKTKKGLGLFQALQLVNINATYLSKNNLQYLGEIGLADLQLSKGIDMNKNFIALFIAEVMTKILQENEVDKVLFQYIWDLKIELNNSTELAANFPLHFLLNLSKILGFNPSEENLRGQYFNLETAEFTDKSSSLIHFMNAENTNYLKLLLEQKEIDIPYINRSIILAQLIDYYKFHHHELKNLTTHLIIESLRS